MVSPKTPEDGATAGSTARGMARIFSISSLQSPVRTSRQSVREALVASVTCARPPVSFHASHESTVPNASSPRSARRRAPGTSSSSQRIFVPEK